MIHRRHTAPRTPRIRNLRDILLREHTLSTRHHMAHRTGIHKQNLTRTVHRTIHTGRLIFRQQPHTRRGTRRRKHIRRQHQHRSHSIALNHGTTNTALTTSISSQRTVRHHHSSRTLHIQLRPHMLHPRKIRVILRRNTKHPARIILNPVPLLDIERRVRQHIIKTLTRVRILNERIAPTVTHRTINTVNRQVQARQTPGRLVTLLTIRQHTLIPLSAAIKRAASTVHKIIRLHKHATRTTARIIHAATRRLNHTHQSIHHSRRSVELATLLTLRTSKLTQEILIHKAQNILRRRMLTITHRREIRIRQQINHLRQGALLHLLTRIHGLQGTLQRRVLSHNLIHRRVNQLTHTVTLRLLHQVRPASADRHIECMTSMVVRRLLQLLSQSLTLQAVLLGQHVLNVFASLIEGVTNVLQEDQAQHEVAVTAGLHRTAQNVRGLPQHLRQLSRSSRGTRPLRYRRFRHYCAFQRHRGWTPDVLNVSV